MRCHVAAEIRWLEDGISVILPPTIELPQDETGGDSIGKSRVRGLLAECFLAKLPLVQMGGRIAMLAE